MDGKWMVNMDKWLVNGVVKIRVVQQLRIYFFLQVLNLKPDNHQQISER